LNIVGKSQVDIARQFTRFQQCGELLKKWRATSFSVKPFQRELGLWENFSTEASYIAGPTVSLADYALWPVLQNIRSEWKNKDGFDNLFVYYCRMRELDSIIKVFGPVDGATSLLEPSVKPPTDD
jgi:glutathione S-transferase